MERLARHSGGYAHEQRGTNPMLNFIKKLTGKDKGSQGHMHAHHHAEGGGCCGGHGKKAEEPKKAEGGCCGGPGHHHHGHDHKTH
jgi:hypothetical protein